MKIRVGVVLKFEHADKLSRIININGVEVAEYYPIFEVPWPDGTSLRHDTFESAVKAYEEISKYLARTTPPSESETQPCQ